MADIKIIVDSGDVVTAAKRVDKLGNSVSSTGKQSQVASNKINSASRGMNQFGAVAKNGGKKLNTFNMQIQQGGYQLQDFVVQLQGGTSVFTAFGQQGSQFAGVFGPKGAVIGAVIAIGSAVGGMAYKMLTAGEEVRDFQEILEETSSALDNLTTATDLAAMSNENLEKTFGAASGQIKSTLALLRELADNEAQRSIDDLASSLSSLYEARGDGDRRTGIADFFDVNIMMAFRDSTRQARDEARVLTAEFLNAQDALVASEGNIQGQIDATQRLLSVTTTLADLDGVRSEEEEALLKKLGESLLSMQKIKTAQEGTNKTQDDSTASLAAQGDWLKIHNTYIQNQQKLRNQNGAELDRQIQLEREVSEYAKNHNWEKTQLQKTTQQILTDAIEVHKQEKAIREELGDAAVEALKLAGIDITTGVDAAAKAAAVLAANLGVSLLAAQNMVNLQGTKTYGGRGSGTEWRGTGDYQNELGYKDVDTLIEELTPKTKTETGGGGKSPQEELAEYLEGKRQELELETKLVGIFGSERSVKSELFEIEQKYGNLIDTTQDSQLAGTLRQIEAEKERNEVLKKAVADQQSIADTLQSSMSDAFMSMVDGTKSFKDAMKDMARAVIKQLYEVLVVQQLVGSFDAKTNTGSGLAGMIMGALPFADGGAFSGGSQIQAYANGGVVGGPTTFPMSGGKTGLMGEAGPEAIMPLKRGSNGKLGVQMEGGGGDTINVVQNFNFQANGDDTVKKLIAQAAPKIAQMTKSSLLDDRRRGGSTKAAFG